MEQKIKLLPMKFPEDKDEIASWETKFAGSPNFESIKHYILEDETYYGLAEVIETNHEIFPIGEDEKKLALVAKNKSNKIVAWVLLDAYDLTTAKPQLFVQYIVVSPEFQHMGYGTEIAKELFLSPEKYTGTKPYEIFAYIEKTNLPSQSLFSKFNFEFGLISGGQYYRAITKEPKLINFNEQIISFDV